MNNQEAKLILQAYRPGGQDASEPFFAEALEQSRRDPELQKWFAEENVLNTRLQTKLEAAIPVPPGLKSDLLALRKTIRIEPWWFQPMKLAAAVVVLLATGLAIYFSFLRAPKQLASFRATMALNSAQTQEHVEFESHDLAKIQQWLQSRNMDANINLPASLQGGTPQGCKVVDWNGRKVTMVCFFLNGKHMDLFVMDRTGLPNYPENGAPQFAKTGGLMTAMWASGGKVYLLTGQDKELLQKVLQPT